jgi:ribosome-associated protein
VSDQKREWESTLRQRIGSRGISFTFARSAGPGGQNVNKVNSRATLWFDLHADNGLSGEEKAQVAARLGGRLSREGLLHVVASRHRTQGANRAAATDRFFELLAGALRPAKHRSPTKPPKSAKLRRLREKQHISSRKSSRAKPALDD